MKARPLTVRRCPAQVHKALKKSAKANQAQLAAALKVQTIGFADLQIAASALEDGAELLTFNTAHFSRVPGLKLAKA